MRIILFIFKDESLRPGMNFCAPVSAGACGNRECLAIIAPRGFCNGNRSVNIQNSPKDGPDRTNDVDGPVRNDPIRIRRAAESDLPAVIGLDERVTGIGKPDYWTDIFARYGQKRLQERIFLVAEAADAASHYPLVGFAVGEIRTWEFGSEPSGWVFAISVEPDSRLSGVGKRLFQAMADRFKSAGIHVMRTMVARDNALHMAFFRSEGMTGGPYLQLELDLI